MDGPEADFEEAKQILQADKVRSLNNSKKRNVRDIQTDFSNS